MNPHVTYLQVCHQPRDRGWEATGHSSTFQIGYKSPMGSVRLPFGCYTGISFRTKSICVGRTSSLNSPSFLKNFSREWVPVAKACSWRKGFFLFCFITESVETRGSLKEREFSSEMQVGPELVEANCFFRHWQVLQPLSLNFIFQRCSVKNPTAFLRGIANSLGTLMPSSGVS